MLSEFNITQILRERICNQYSMGQRETQQQRETDREMDWETDRVRQTETDRNRQTEMRNTFITGLFAVFRDRWNILTNWIDCERNVSDRNLGCSWTRLCSLSQWWGLTYWLTHTAGWCGGMEGYGRVVQWGFWFRIIRTHISTMMCSKVWTQNSGLAIQITGLAI